MSDSRHLGRGCETVYAIYCVIRFAVCVMFCTLGSHLACFQGFTGDS